MECSERVVLASASPRRRELLGRFGLPFEVLPARGGEEPPLGRSAGEYVKALAAAKGQEVSDRLNDASALIIAADTVVEIDGEILGKPAAPAEAEAMLRRLSGATHRVWTGVCVRRGDTVRAECECTEVCFRDLTEEELRAYVAAGEPMDKAGAYGIQDRAGLFVSGLRGDYFNVMGLPLCRLGLLLREFGVSLL